MRGERRRHRRRGRLLAWCLSVLVLLAVLYVVLDVIASTIAENQLRQAVVSRTGAASASARVSTVPLLFDIVALGSASGIDLRLHDVPVDGLDVSTIQVTAASVHIDRGVLIGSRKIRVTGISGAEVTATVTAAAIGKVIHHEVLLEGGNTVRVHVGPLFVPATLAITHGHYLTIEEQGLQLLHVNLSVNPLVQACALQLTVGHGSASLTCHISTVPPSLLSTISSG